MVRNSSQFIWPLMNNLMSTWKKFYWQFWKALIRWGSLLMNIMPKNGVIIPAFFHIVGDIGTINVILDYRNFQVIWRYYCPFHVSYDLIFFPTPSSTFLSLPFPTFFKLKYSWHRYLPLFLFPSTCTCSAYPIPPPFPSLSPRSPSLI